MEKIDIQILTKIAIALGIVIIFRILSSLLSKIIIKILRINKNEKVDVSKNPFYRPLRTIFTFILLFTFNVRINEDKRLYILEVFYRFYRFIFSNFFYYK